MILRVLTFLLFFSVSASLPGQDQLRVILSAGPVYAEQDKRFHQLISGEKISTEAQLELVDFSQLILMDEEGRLLTLTQQGKYDLSKTDLTELSPPSQAVFSLWDSYYSEEASAPHSAERVNLLLESPTNRLSAVIPSSVSVFGAATTLSWRGKGENYRVDLLNEFDEVFRSVEVEEPSAELDLLDKELVWKKYIGIRITDIASGERTGVYVLDRQAPPDHDRTEAKLEAFPTNETIASKLTQAVFFEQNGLFCDAFSILNDLLKRNPKIMSAHYQAFLDRNGFTY